MERRRRKFIVYNLLLKILFWNHVSFFFCSIFYSFLLNIMREKLTKQIHECSIEIDKMQRCIEIRKGKKNLSTTKTKRKHKQVFYTDELFYWFWLQWNTSLQHYLLDLFFLPLTKTRNANVFSCKQQMNIFFSQFDATYTYKHIETSSIIVPLLPYYLILHTLWLGIVFNFCEQNGKQRFF